MDRDFVDRLLKKVSQLNDFTFRKIYDSLLNNPDIRSTLNPAFPFPRVVRFGLLREHLVVEYVGPEQQEDDFFEVKCAFYDSFLSFLEVDILHLHYQTMPMLNFPEIRIFDENEDRVENILMLSAIIHISSSIKQKVLVLEGY